VKISELAQRAGVNVQTVRFYEREGLIPCPDRTPGGYRCYSPSDLRRIQNIRDLQAVGFTLRDIRELFTLGRMITSTSIPPDVRSSARAKVLKRAEDRLMSLEDNLQRLHAMKARMERVVEGLAGSAVGIDIFGSI
jgi:DNA-binding transcriptional MerR regulator